MQFAKGGTCGVPLGDPNDHHCAPPKHRHLSSARQHSNATAAALPAPLKSQPSRERTALPSEEV
eukprot:2035160-Amphidinium_carterae.1